MRYVRLLGSLAKFTLARELSFRGNFLVKISVELIWLGIMLAFYDVVFAKTTLVAGWSKSQYLFFVGCFFALNGVIETLFMENCNDFAELIRTGDLDFLLLKPIDEQFLITCRRVDWATGLNFFMGCGVMLLALLRMGWRFDPIRLGAFVLLFACGVAIAYGFMVVLTSSSVWLVRNQSLLEMWWLFSSLARYPRELFKTVGWAEPIGMLFTYVVPILIVVSVPSDVMVRAFDPRMIVFTTVAAVAILALSRRFFRHALRSYRSASS